MNNRIKQSFFSFNDTCDKQQPLQPTHKFFYKISTKFILRLDEGQSFMIHEKKTKWNPSS